MSLANLGHTLNIKDATFDEVLERTTAALAVEGFGVITTIDVKATMKKKLGEDFRPYHILGACNPGFAHKALSADAGVGLLMPCNVIVYAEDDGSTTVSLARPAELFKLVEMPGMEPLMQEIDGAIARVAASL